MYVYDTFRHCQPQISLITAPTHIVLDACTTARSRDESVRISIAHPHGEYLIPNEPAVTPADEPLRATDIMYAWEYGRTTSE